MSASAPISGAGSRRMGPINQTRGGFLSAESRKASETIHAIDGPCVLGARGAYPRSHRSRLLNRRYSLLDANVPSNA